MSTFLMTDWTFFTETKFAHTPVEVKSTRTNGTQMVGIKKSHTPEEKIGRPTTCGLCDPSASGVCCWCY
jgi:hypothetical protein